MRGNVLRLPTPREYMKLSFDEKQDVIERVRELMFTYLVTERGSNV